jgi:uncharacterized protein (DUF4415 family)
MRRKGDFMKKSDKVDDYVPNPNFTREDWEEVSDSPEWTKEDFAKARPFAEVFPEIARALELKRGRGKQKAETKQLVSLRMDRDIVERFKADGKGWQSRINDTLRKAIGA